MPNFDFDDELRRSIEYEREKHSGTTQTKTAPVDLTKRVDETVSLLEQFSPQEQKHLLFIRWMVEQERLTDWPKEGNTGVSL